MQAFVSAAPLLWTPTPASKRVRPLRRRAPPSACERAPGPDPDNEPPPLSANWREFRAALVAGSVAKHEEAKRDAYRPGHWAHALSLPETGCFLASHPAYYRRHAPYLTQAVVFLIDYSLERGGTGLVLNRPLAGSADQLLDKGLFGRSTAAVSDSAFASQPVYLGGPHGLPEGMLSVVHAGSGLQDADDADARQPLAGVFLHDLPDFLTRREQLRRDDPAECRAARLFAGCVRWQPGMLETEVDEGSWFCVSASERYALEHCIQLPKPLWVEIMQAQGQPFARIAGQVYSEEDGPKQQ